MAWPGKERRPSSSEAGSRQEPLAGRSWPFGSPNVSECKQILRGISALAARCLPGRTSALCRRLVKPSRQKYSTLPKFGFVVCLAQPGSSLRGDREVVMFASRACGGRGSVGRERLGQGGLLSASPKPRVDERRCQVRLACKFPALSTGLGKLRRIAGRAYGKTVWSWPSLLRSSSCGCGSCVNRRAAGDFREGEGGQNELGSRESTA
ncbi:hypothetical protein SAMN05192541_108243 [Bradyrhizobium arachidis]|nr:hypothetical protein SAMN05192541_108243 [Bradyrhizobium arachidis]